MYYKSIMVKWIKHRKILPIKYKTGYKLIGIFFLLPEISFMIYSKKSVYKYCYFKKLFFYLNFNSTKYTSIPTD